MRKSTEYIVIHCSATPAKMDVDVRDIDRWHRQKGWLMVGYHFVIKRDGTLQKGRDLDQAGAHVEGLNHCSVGVCMVGGMDAKNEKPENNFTPSQWRVLGLTLIDLEKRYPTAKIVGHYELQPNKACPSFSVPVYLRERANEHAGIYKEKSLCKPPSTPLTSSTVSTQEGKTLPS